MNRIELTAAPEVKIFTTSLVWGRIENQYIQISVQFTEKIQQMLFSSVLWELCDLFCRFFFLDIFSLFNGFILAHMISNSSLKFKKRLNLIKKILVCPGLCTVSMVQEMKHTKDTRVCFLFNICQFIEYILYLIVKWDELIWNSNKTFFWHKCVVWFL